MNDKLKFYRKTLVEMTKEVYRKMPNELKIEESVVEGDLLTKAIMKQVDEYENSFNYQTQVNENPKVNYCFGGDNCVAKDFTCTDSNFFKGVNPDYLKTEPMGTIVDNGPQYSSYNKEELDYVCKLTQWDIDDLKQRLNLAIKAFDKYKTNGEEFKQSAEDVLKMYINDVIEFLDNKDNIRTKCQNDQIARKIEKANQKPYGTFVEHWYELMRLFEVKDFYCDWKKYLSEVIEVIKKNKEARFNSSAKNTEYIVIKGIADKLGIEFIEDFVKACEKCEE